MPLFVYITSHQVKSQGQFAVGYFIRGEETSNISLWRGIIRIGLRHEQATIIDRDVEGGISLVYYIEKLLQLVIENSAEIMIRLLQFARRLILYRSSPLSDLPFEPLQARFVVPTHFAHRQ